MVFTGTRGDDSKICTAVDSVHLADLIGLVDFVFLVDTVSIAPQVLIPEIESDRYCVLDCCRVLRWCSIRKDMCYFKICFVF
jgi:hypothetical protein